MKLLLPFLFAPMALLATPLAAMAALPLGSATFTNAAELPAKLVVNESIWHCDAGGCRGPAEDRKVAVQKVCKDLARKIGAVSTLSVGKTTLAADELAACNRGAKGTAS